MKINQSAVCALVLSVSVLMLPVCWASHATALAKHHKAVRPVLVHHSSEKVLLNKASVHDLMKLPGIGKVMAGRMVVYRAKHGAFTSVDQLLSIKGVSKARLAKFRKRIRLK